MPLVSRTRATLRSAELGFFGVWVYTRVQTPRFCGQDCSAGLAVLYFGAVRPLRTSWLNVGTLCSSFIRNASARLAQLQQTLGRTRPQHLRVFASAAQGSSQFGAGQRTHCPYFPAQTKDPGNIGFRSG